MTKFTLSLVDYKEFATVMEHVSQRVTHVTFVSLGTDPLFSDVNIWKTLEQCSSLVYLNLYEISKLSKPQIPLTVTQRVKTIVYPMFVHNAYACYDYQHPDPNAKEFFSFKAGDKFNLLPSARDLQGWKIAVNENGEKGFVPGNYLVFVDENKS